MIDLAIDKIVNKIELSRIRCPEPAKGSEYWLCGTATSSIEGALRLAAALGLEWRFEGQEEMVVTLVGGPDDGDLDVLSPSELTRVTGPSTRLLLSWKGYELPLRVLLSPGVGVKIDISHLREQEFRALHETIITRIIPKLLRAVGPELLFVGVDTRGVVDLVMDAFVRGEEIPYREVQGGPDFLVTSKLLWTPSAFIVETDHHVDMFNDVIVLTSL